MSQKPATGRGGSLRVDAGEGAHARAQTQTQLQTQSQSQGHPLGFTLLEVLAALAIVAVLVGVAAPSWVSWRQRRQLQAEAEDLLASLALARAQALMQAQRVSLCPSRSGAACDDAGAGSGSGWGAGGSGGAAWQGGWIVFVDRNRNGVREADEPLLQRRVASPPGVQIVARSPLSQSIAYGADGGSEGLHGQFLAGTVQLCTAGQNEGWQLVLNALGRARLAKVLVDSCP